MWILFKQKKDQMMTYKQQLCSMSSNAADIQAA